MSYYWIRDDRGRVLGPVGAESLKALVGSGRLGVIELVSRDGSAWSPLAKYPELAAIVGGARDTAPAPSEQAALAARIRSEIAWLLHRPPEEVLGLTKGASLDACRTAFFRAAKRYFPDRLPESAYPELRVAFGEMFRFLSATMRRLERERTEGASGPPKLTPERRGDATTAGPRGVSPVTPGPPGLARTAGPRGFSYPTPGPRGAFSSRGHPTYRAEEFIGISQRDLEVVEATVRVSALVAPVLFVDHPIVNLRSSGVFLPGPQIVKLGKTVELSLVFGEPDNREIQLRGKVVWENARRDLKYPFGFGVSVRRFDKADRAFLDEYVRWAITPGEEA